MTQRRRVVITGLGLVTPIGVGVDDFWTSILAGRAGVGRATSFDPSSLPTHIVGAVDSFDATEFMDRRRAQSLERFCQLALAAAHLAIVDAALSKATMSPERTGVVIGTGMGGVARIEHELDNLHRAGPRAVSPLAVPRLIPNAAAGEVAISFDLRGPNECPATACAAGAHAIARAVDYIRYGMADRVLAGGTEACLTLATLAGFSAAQVLSTRNSQPHAASRPFDLDRDGLVLAEGAAVLVLESLETAVRRSARIRAEVVGYGLSSDAYNPTRPRPDGTGAASAMRAALSDAAIDPDRVDYINAHGTSTVTGDAVEALAIHETFRSRPPVSSIKAVTGHMLGASGAVEAAATALALEVGVLPPSTNCEMPDPACDVNLVGSSARPQHAEYALSNTFAFGGHNVSLLLRSCPQ